MKFSPYILILCVLLNPLHAAEQIYIDSILAIVEDDVITNREVIDEINRIREEMSKKGRELTASTSLNRQVLELMINKSILSQEAKNRGIKITDTQLNNTLQNLAKKNDMNLTQFRQALLTNGMDYISFRNDLRDELAISRIKNSYARQNVDISEQEVNDALLRSDGETREEYKLSHILVSLPDGASSEQVSEALKKIQDISNELSNGADFSQLASEKSEGSNALQGGDLGWRKPAQIPSLFADVVPNLKINQVSDPIRSASGFHLVTVTDKRSAEQVIINQTKARHILIKENELLNSEQARAKLEQIRYDILDGADFAELAEQYSNDPGSSGLGGDLGWFSKGQMVPEFDKMVENTQIGETSPVFRSSFGWHILQVLDHRTVDETEESKREKIRAQLEEQKTEEVLELWQRRLRDQAFVKLVDE